MDYGQCYKNTAIYFIYHSPHCPLISFKVLNYSILFVTYDFHCMKFVTEYTINMITPITHTSSRSTSVIINSPVTNLVIPFILLLCFSE